MSVSSYYDKQRRMAMIVRAELKKQQGQWVSINKLGGISKIDTGLGTDHVIKLLNKDFKDFVEYDELGEVVRWKNEEE